MEANKNKGNIFNVVQILALAIFVVSPIVFLSVAYFVEMPISEFESIDLIMYLLLFISIFFPTLTIPIRRFFVAKSHQSDMTDDKRAPMFLTMFIMIAAMVEAVYVFGLVVYFLSGDIVRMLYFYPIGIAWTFMHWPTRDKFESFVSPPGRP